MFNRVLSAKVHELERQVSAIIAERNCSQNKHEWEIVGGINYRELPYVRCKHCWKKPTNAT